MTFPEHSFQAAVTSKELDLRVTKDGRFMDQKVTPDVLAYISDAILNLTPADQLTFTKNSIWSSPYFQETVRDVFGKPDADNNKAEHEYDKFSAQPLKMLAYCGVLKEEKSHRTNYYTLLEKDALEYISQGPRTTIEFLDRYLQLVLKKSDLWKHFENYFESACLDADLQKLKNEYVDFMLANTMINTRVEVSRIFTKVLNPLAFKRQKPGTSRGHASKHAILFAELMYNQVNFRDAGKSKNLTRAEGLSSKPTHSLGNKKYQDYLNQKAKQSINRRHSPLSEVSGFLSEGRATQVHHIFPVSSHPKLFDVPENLILLTPSQHMTLAHPENKTFLIDEAYQLTCLMAKLESVKESDEKSDGFYDLVRFIYIINEGLMLNLDPQMSFNEVLEFLKKRSITK